MKPTKKTENTTAAAMPSFTMDDLPVQEQSRIRFVEAACRSLDDCNPTGRALQAERVTRLLNEHLAEYRAQHNMRHRDISAKTLIHTFYLWVKSGRDPLSLADKRVLINRRRRATVA